MKLKYKAWALVFITVGLCSLLAVLGARWIVAASFADMEAERALREGERASRLVNQQLQGLGAQVRNAAYSVDLVAYLEGSRPKELERRFDVTTMSDLGVSGVLLVDRSGSPAGSVRPDRMGGLDQIEEGLTIALAGLTRSVLADSYGGATLQTLFAFNGQLYQVAVAAVLDPMKSNPPSGAMVMIRHLSAAEIQSLAHVLMRPVRLDMLSEGPSASRPSMEIIDDQSADLRTPLLDSEGVPLAQLVLSLDRPLREGQQQVSQAGMLLAGLAGLLASLLLSVVLYRLVLRRLSHLHADLTAITESGPATSGDVRVEGRDELGMLAQGLNQLLDRVRQDAVLQQQAHERQEALQVQLMQSQKTEALGRLTGGIAHDFNNSLAAITGWVRLASEDLEPGHPSAGALEQTLKATRYADGLMRQLLAFGRQSAPKLERLRWSVLINETRQMVSAGLTRECELLVECHTTEDLIEADPTQMQQVLVNLLINASDAMNGRGRIHLALDEAQVPQPQSTQAPGLAGLPPGRYLRLSVRDEGPGIAPENREHIFDPFFTTKSKGRGTGLGLSVVHGIMSRHHGCIVLSSEPGQGACFQLYLPAVSPQADADRQIVGADGEASHGRSVLFADDDQLVRHAWTALLERQGWLVTRARDGEEAWNHYVQSGKHFDVILTDHSMPRLDGVGLAQRLRERATPPPIVLISGHVSEVPADTLKTLFDAVLHKPVDAGELDKVLRGMVAAGESRY